MPPKSQSFVLMKDPALPTTDVDLAASTKAQVRVRDAMNETVDIINKLEVMRRQIEDTLKVRGGDASLAEQLKALDKKMLDVELMLLSKTDLHSDELNPKGVNALRQIPGAGRVVWGARTMIPSSEWRYMMMKLVPTAARTRRTISTGSRIRFSMLPPQRSLRWLVRRHRNWLSR